MELSSIRAFLRAEMHELGLSSYSESCVEEIVRQKLNKFHKIADSAFLLDCVRIYYTKNIRALSGPASTLNEELLMMKKENERKLAARTEEFNEKIKEIELRHKKEVLMLREQIDIQRESLYFDSLPAVSEKEMDLLLKTPAHLLPIDKFLVVQLHLFMNNELFMKSAFKKQFEAESERLKSVNEEMKQQIASLEAQNKHLNAAVSALTRKNERLEYLIGSAPPNSNCA